MNIIPKNLVETVKWEGHKKDYDFSLFQLGQGLDNFYVVNPIWPDIYINAIDKEYTSDKCILWTYGKDWIVKQFNKDWTPSAGWEIKEVTNMPVQQWEVNPDIDPSILFAKDPFNRYDIPRWDVEYEHIWYLDPKFNICDDKVWVYKTSTNWKSNQTKDMGYITPDVVYEFNPELPEIHLNLDTIPLYDLKYEHVWDLDADYNAWDDMWCVKVRPSWKEVDGIKYKGMIHPEFKVVYNKEVPDLKLNIDYKVPFYDFKYEHIWYLDPKFSNGKKIWLARLTAVDFPEGVKDMGFVVPDIAEQLDVVFISYNEPNAEENWQRVLEKAPKAKRVDKVKGIFEAHKQAAGIASSDMFYVVDGDAFLTDDWEFDFNPNIFDRDCVHVYKSKNPINDLTYGYGGVKLFPRKLLSEATEWNVDMTTSIANKLKIINKVSNITAFNTDEFSTWRSAFRECAKLSSAIIDNQKDAETERRLKIWMSKGASRTFGKEAIAGAQAGYKFGIENKLNIQLLKQINDRDWLYNLWTTTKKT